MELTKRMNIRYMLIQAVYYAGFCASIGYASVYLLSKGFSNSEIGTLLAVTNVLSVFLQSALASYADSHKNVRLQTIILWCGVITLAASAVYGFLPAGIGVIIAMVTISFSLTNTLMPLINSLAFAFEKRGFIADYGLGRGVGSLAYALMSVAAGHMARALSPDILPVFYIVFNVLLIISVKMFVLPKNAVAEAVKAESAEKAEQKQLSLPQFARKYKVYILFLIGFVLVYLEHAFINNFYIQILSPIGGTSVEMGYAISLSAVLELPMMAYFTRLTKHFKCVTLLKFSIVMFLVKHLITYFATSIGMIYFASFLQMFAYALMMPAGVYYINERIDAADRVKGQSLFTIAMVAAAMIADLFGGMMLDSIGVHMTLLVCLIITAAGAAVIFATVDRI